jgi:hypothetical protein
VPFPTGSPLNFYKVSHLSRYKSIFHSVLQLQITKFHQINPAFHQHSSYPPSNINQPATKMQYSFIIVGTTVWAALGTQASPLVAREPTSGPPSSSDTCTNGSAYCCNSVGIGLSCILSSLLLSPTCGGQTICCQNTGSGVSALYRCVILMISNCGYIYRIRPALTPMVFSLLSPSLFLSPLAFE